MNVESIFATALAIPGPADRIAFLDRVCADNPVLRKEIDELLAAHDVSNLLDRTGAYISTGESASVGDHIGPFQLLERIGEGGMGEVWVAEQTEPIRRRVALKLIRPGMDSRSVLARFEAERQALALMDHPNIARVLDAGTTDQGRPFFVMELIDGIPITTFCDEKKLAIADRLEIFLTVCRAVQHAHQKGIIHRDLKPTNVLVAEVDGRPVPKVIDFGLAKALHSGALPEITLNTGFGTVLGTPLYMAPEQAVFDATDVDTRADIYALGAILYELLTGTTPIDRDTIRGAAVQEILRVIREVEPTMPSKRVSESAKLSRLLRGDLEWIAMKCLEKDRNRRYETADQLGAEVRRYLRNEPVSAGPPSRWYRARKFVRRNRAAVIAGSLILLVLIAGITGTTIGLIRAEWAAEVAREEATTSRSVINFLTEGILGQTDPLKQPDRDLKLRTVLDRAAENIDGRFEKHPLVEAGIREMIGSSYHELGEYELARIHLDRAVELYRRERGEDAAVTLSARHKRGRLDLTKGTTGGTETELLQILEGVNRVHGIDSPQSFAVMNNLAILYWQQKRFDEAEKLYLQIIDGLRRTTTPDDMTVYKPMSNLGVLYTVKKEYAKAEPILREVLVARRRHFGDDHLETAEAKYNLFNVLWNSDRREEAWPLLEEAVPVIRKVLGDDNPAGSVVLFKYAFEMILTEDELKAQPLMLGCLRAERKKPGTTSGILSGAELNVEMLLLADQPVPARELAEELILTAEMIDPNGWRQFAAKSMIGESYTQEKKYPQAEPFLKAGYEGLRQQIDLKVEPQVRQLKDALKRLVEFYKVTNKPDEATKWQKELDRLPKE